jgi:stage V sporulation protein R
MLVNFGQPVIYVEDSNYQNRGELYLKHNHDRVDLKVDYALDVLKNLTHIWTRPVHIETKSNGKKVLYSYDGEKHKENNLECL